MKKLIASALLLALGAPAIAHAADQSAERRFTRDGETYVYTVAEKADRVVLAGRRLSSGEKFEFVVRGNRVQGFANNMPVAFKVPNAQANISRAQVASR